MPMLDLFLTKNPIFFKFFAKAITSPIINFGRPRMMKRLNKKMQEEPAIEIKDLELRAKELRAKGPSKPDFLSHFLTLRETNPDIVTDKQLLVCLFVRVIFCFSSYSACLSYA